MDTPVEKDAKERAETLLDATYQVYAALTALPDQMHRQRVLLAAQALLGLQWEDMQALLQQARGASLLKYPDRVVPSHAPPQPIITMEPAKR